VILNLTFSISSIFFNHSVEDTLLLMQVAKLSLLTVSLINAISRHQDHLLLTFSGPSPIF
jgi:hypothetical protein